LRRLRVAQCGRGAFRVGERRANDGPRAVPVHSALVRTTIRLTGERAGGAFLIRDDAEFGRAPSPMQLRFDACRIAVGVVGPSLGIHGLRRWFEGAALEAGQPPDDVATVVGHARSDDGRLRPEPTWGQRCACVEAVHLPRATL
jgi:integrase